MAKYADIEIVVLGDGDASVHCTVDDGGDYEQDLFIPHSQLEDLRPLDNTDKDGKCTVSVAKWWLRANNVPYESESGWSPE